MNGLNQYVGSRSRYHDIATRGTEALGLAVEYAPHPNGKGYFIIRFVAHGKEGASYSHFHNREKAKFLALDANGHKPNHAEIFKGVRLNKLAIPVFEKAVHPYEVLTFGDELGVWDVVADWIVEQLAAEGFSLVEGANVADLVRSLFVLPTTPKEAVATAFEFPDLTAEKKQVPFKPHLVKDDEDDDDGDDDDDNDGEDDEVVN